MNIKKITLVVLISAVLGACGGAEERKQVYLERGKTYLEEENFDKARVEIKNVLQIDPEHAEAYLLLGRIMEKEQEWRKAYGNYTKAVELDPNLLDARMRLGQFMLLQANAARSRGEPEAEAEAVAKVREHLAAIRKADPQHPGVPALSASLKARDGDRDGAIALLKPYFESRPDETEVAVLLSSLYQQAERPDQAQQVLKRAVEASPDEISLKVQLAQAYARDQKTEEAIQAMRQAIEQKPENLGYRVSLASYYAQLDRVEEAEQVLREAIAADPEDPERYLVLVDFLNNRVSFERAVEELQTAIDKLPDAHQLSFALARLHGSKQQTDERKAVLKAIVDRWGTEPPGLEAKVTLAQIAAGEEDLDTTRRLVAEVLEENPNDSGALMLKARLALMDKNYTDAITALRTVVKDQPDNAHALTLLAGAHMQNGEMELAGDHLRRAVEADPDNVDARLRYAGYLLRRGELNSAEQQVDAVLEANPEESRALVAKTNILAAKNDPDQLKDVIGSMQAADPDSPEGYFRMGRVHRTMGDLEAAHAEYEKALARAEGQGAMLMLGEMVSLEIQMDRLEAAEARVQAALKEDPEHPSAHGLLATIRMAQERYSEAEREYLAQIEVAPDAAAQPYARLAAARMAQKDLDGAIEAYRMGLEQHPESPNLLIPLAGVYERKGDYDQAITLYEQVLETSPDNAVATNNLAALLSDHRTDPASLDRALELAEKFRNSEQTAFLDTLGWIHYRRGEYEQAVDVLSGVVKQVPDVVIFQYHLGMAHHGAGNADQAREHLQKAVDADVEFAGIEEARKVLEGLE